MSADPDTLLTVWDVANGMRIGEETVRRWLRSGKLRGICLSRKAGWRIRESDLYAFLDTLITQNGETYPWPRPWPIYSRVDDESEDEEVVEDVDESDNEDSE